MRSSRVRIFNGNQWETILLNACEEELSALDLYINQRNSMCIRFGKRFAEKCAELVTASGERLRWVDRCRCLGVYFTSEVHTQ